MKSGEARKDSGTRQTTNAPNNSVEKKDGSNVTLSGLLNALDGFSAPDNVLFVMTSNQIEALDPALLRPGRIDYRLYLGPATEEQKVELYRRFFSQTSMLEAQLFVSGRPVRETMAEFQGSLLALEESSRSVGSNGVQVALDFEPERTEEEMDNKVSCSCGERQCMTVIRIRSGTPQGSESLCNSCSWAHIQRGFAESEEVVLCAFLRQARSVPFKVSQCTDYNDKRIPSKRDMEDIAWIIRTKDVNRAVGFASQKEVDGEGERDLEIVPSG